MDMTMCDAEWLKGLWQDARYVEGLFPNTRYLDAKHGRLVSKLNGKTESPFKSRLDALIAGAPVLVKHYN